MCHISFRAEGQERFTRVNKFGFYYQEENIRYRIDRRLMHREGLDHAKEILDSLKWTKKFNQYVEIKAEVSELERLKRSLVALERSAPLKKKINERG